MTVCEYSGSDGVVIYLYLVTMVAGEAPDVCVNMPDASDCFGIPSSQVEEDGIEGLYQRVRELVYLIQISGCDVIGSCLLISGD